MTDVQWFQLTSPYNTGRYRGTFELTEDLTLLNLGDPIDRQLVVEHTYLQETEIDPTVQYYSHSANLRVQRAIAESTSIHMSHFDGTIVSDEYTHQSLVKDLGAVHEVVLFMHKVQSLKLVKVQAF